MANSDQSARGRVLVVDDDAALAEMLTIVLRQEGFECRVCPSGDRAMADFAVNRQSPCERSYAIQAAYNPSQPSTTSPL